MGAALIQISTRFLRHQLKLTGLLTGLALSGCQFSSGNALLPRASSSKAQALNSPAKIPSPAMTNPITSTLPSQSPTAFPVISPSHQPTSLPDLASPSPTPSPMPSPIHSDNPLPECPVSDIGFETCVSLHGVIYDNNKNPVKNAKIDLFKLNSFNNGKNEYLLSRYSDDSGSYNFSRTSDGHFFLEASKAGYTKRSFTYFGNTGYPKSRIDFGGDGSQTFHHPTLFLDDRPEVVSAGPNQASRFVREFFITFNEPVQTADVERKLHIVCVNNCDLQVFQSFIYTGTYVSMNSLFTFWKPEQPLLESSLVLSPQQFDFKWNSEKTTVIVSLKPSVQLMTNKDLSEPQFGLAFVDPEGKDRGIRDLAGNARLEKHFVYGDPSQASDYYKYIIRTDEEPPRLLSLQALEASLRLNFSEIMAIQTYKHLIAGSMIDMLPPGLPGSETRSPAEYPGNLGNVTGRKTAANYKLKITRAGSELLNTTWKALGGVARYDSEDTSRQSVRLYPPRSTQAVNGFYPDYSWISTTALPAGFGQGSSPEQTWTLRWQGVRRDGTLGTQRTATLAGNTLRTAPEWATQLQLALQANSSEEGNWQVQASADGSQLKLRLESTDGEYLGWKLVSMESPSAAFPSTLATASQNWAANTDWHWWQAGDSLTLEVINPIFDPAGNSIDPAGKTASLTLP
jgi:hypothetical protein